MSDYQPTVEDFRRLARERGEAALDDAADLIQSQQQRIKALSKVASEARGLLDSIQSGALSRNNCENLSMELIEDIDKALTDTTKAETNNEDQNSS